MTTDTDAAIKARDIAGELWEAAIRCDFDAFKIEVANALATTPSAQEEAVRICEWSNDEYEYSWDTGCGQKWGFVEGGPKENRMHFCHACGGKLTIKDGAAASAGDQEVNDGR